MYCSNSGKVKSYLGQWVKEVDIHFYRLSSYGGASYISIISGMLKFVEKTHNLGLLMCFCYLYKELSLRVRKWPTFWNNQVKFVFKESLDKSIAFSCSFREGNVTLRSPISSFLLINGNFSVPFELLYGR